MVFIKQENIHHNKIDANIIFIHHEFWDSSLFVMSCCFKMWHKIFIKFCIVLAVIGWWKFALMSLNIRLCENFQMVRVYRFDLLPTKNSLEIKSNAQYFVSHDNS